MKKDTRIFISVRNRQESLFEGEVKAVSSFNEIGPFDILPQHANFISLIQKALVIHQIGGTRNEIKFDVAILRIVENKAEVYLGIRNLSQINV